MVLLLLLRVIGMVLALSSMLWVVVRRWGWIIGHGVTRRQIIHMANWGCKRRLNMRRMTVKIRVHIERFEQARRRYWQLPRSTSMAICRHDWRGQWRQTCIRSSHRATWQTRHSLTRTELGTVRQPRWRRDCSWWALQMLIHACRRHWRSRQPRRRKKTIVMMVLRLLLWMRVVTVDEVGRIRVRVLARDQAWRRRYEIYLGYTGCHGLLLLLYSIPSMGVDIPISRGSTSTTRMTLLLVL